MFAFKLQVEMSGGGCGSVRYDYYK